MKLTLQQLEAHLWGAANILRGKTAGQMVVSSCMNRMNRSRIGPPS